MTWTVGYPQGYLYLDDQHEALGRRLVNLKNATSDDDDSNAKLEVLGIRRELRQHFDSEEEVMESTGFPDRHLHSDYHQFSMETFETVLLICDHSFIGKHRHAIASHIENRLLEEIFVDRLFAAFLHDQAAGTA